MGSQIYIYATHIGCKETMVGQPPRLGSRSRRWEMQWLGLKVHPLPQHGSKKTGLRKDWVDLSREDVRQSEQLGPKCATVVVAAPSHGSYCSLSLWNSTTKVKRVLSFSVQERKMYLTSQLVGSNTESLEARKIAEFLGDDTWD